MKKHSQSGFAVVESVVALLLVVAIVGVGYYVWHNHKNQPTVTTAATSTPNYQSPTTNVPTAPQINSPSDLNSAMQALNQTSVTSSNADSAQLSQQANGF